MVIFGIMLVPETLCTIYNHTARFLNLRTTDILGWKIPHLGVALYIQGSLTASLLPGIRESRPRAANSWATEKEESWGQRPSPVSALEGTLTLTLTRLTAVQWERKDKAGWTAKTQKGVTRCDSSVHNLAEVFRGHLDLELIKINIIHSTLWKTQRTQHSKLAN